VKSEKGKEMKRKKEVVRVQESVKEV